VRIEAACDDVFISFFLWKPRSLRGKNKNPPESPAGFRKRIKARLENPPAQNDMPRYALQRGGDHRLGQVHEHYDGMLWQLVTWVNEFASQAGLSTDF
jgi:hypothetical protein